MAKKKTTRTRRTTTKPAAGAGSAKTGAGSRSKAPASKKTAKKAAKKITKKAAAKSGSPSATESAAGTEALAGVRKQIDRIDAKLVKLLNERAAIVREVGRMKRGSGVPVYAPHREAEVIERALAASDGTLPDRSIEAIYKELMSGSFALEQPLRIGFLGPPGSHSHVAARKQFGSSVDFEDLHAIGGVFTEVRRGHVDYGLVPIENSIGGGIVETLDAFVENAASVTIYAEVHISIHHTLLANCKPSEIRRVHSKPEVFAQCRNWLATQLPHAEQIPGASSSRAVQTAVEESRKAEEIGVRPASAAIGTALAGEMYGLKTLFPRIEDNPDNITRFFVISRQKAKRSGDDKTSILFHTADKPGALVEALQVFHAAGVNLTHIDKRPSGRTNWEYLFFVDAQGHRDDPVMSGVIRELEHHCREVTVLGSYPRAKRIL